MPYDERVNDGLVATALPAASPPTAPNGPLLAAAQRHYDAGRLAEAQAVCREVIAAHSQDVDTARLSGAPAESELPLVYLILGSALQAQNMHAEASASFESALAIAPDDVEVINNLGVSLAALGRLDEAVTRYRRALSLAPGVAAAHFNLGNALLELDQPVAAEASYRRAIALEPTLAAFHNNLGNALAKQDKPDEAIDCYRRATALDPGHARAHFNLANSLLAGGELAAAEDSLRRAIALAPERGPPHKALGKVYAKQEKFDRAVESFERAIALDPGDFEAYFNLGNALLEQGKVTEAEANYRRAIELQPTHPPLHNNLGNALTKQGKLDDAIKCYQQAIALDPKHYRAHFNLGNALRDQGKSDEALASYRRSLAINPDYAKLYNNLAGMLKAQGRAAEAVTFYRRAVELSPDERFIHSNLLMTLQYDPAMTPAALLAEHCAYDAALPRRAPIVHANLRDPDRRLKIGYVSEDFRLHPVGSFLVPVLASHDRANFAVHCYYGHTREDPITAFLKSNAEVWRSTVGIGDDALTAMILRDGIDILVDLAGHTAGNRLPVFARRPAPVQVTWAGYVGTTGLAAIDYLIVDRWQSPPGSRRYTMEKLVLLPDGYICWAPPGNSSEVGALPANQPGAVTFGCFNNLAKINPLVIALWGRLLRELPQSRLLMKTRELHDGPIRERILALFEVEDVAPDRIILEGMSPHLELLNRYSAVDIALDPFPYSGGVTTIEALWMGVPVVTMPGERFASRHSLSHLNNVGLGELAAESPEAYLRIATELACDLPRLAALRAGMRDRLRASPLLQGVRFTRGLEQAFRTMWRTWCEQAH